MADVKEYRAFLPIERTLGSLAYEAMRTHADGIKQAVKSAILARDYSTAYEVLPNIDFQQAEHAIKTKAQPYFHAAYLLGASFVHRGLRNLPKNAIQRFPAYAQNSITNTHADIVSTRAEIIIRQALVKLIRSYQYDFKTGDRKILAVRKADDDTDLIDALNSAVDGNSQMMAAASANLSTSRLVSYGFLSEADHTGTAQYQIQAVLDERTSEICQELNGRTFDVQIALDFMNSLMQATDPESLRALAPFVNSGTVDQDDIPEMSDDDLQSQGVMVPPFHFSCRSILVMVGDVQIDEDQGPVDVSDMDAEDQVELPGLGMFDVEGADDLTSVGEETAEVADEDIYVPGDIAEMENAPAVVGGDEETLEFDDGTVIESGVLSVQGNDAIVEDGEFKGWRNPDAPDDEESSSPIFDDSGDQKQKRHVEKMGDSTHDVPAKPEQWHAVLNKYHDLQMLLLRPVAVIRTRHVPYVAGAAKDGTHVYVDPCVPDFIKLYGKHCDPSKYLVRHEIVEWWLMVNLGWGYYKAHSYALTAEHELMHQDGFDDADVDSYEGQMKKYIHEDEAEVIKNLPDDLYPGPYLSGGQNAIDKKVLAQLGVIVQKGGVGSGIKGHVTIHDQAMSGKYSSADWSKAGVSTNLAAVNRLNGFGVSPDEFKKGMLGGNAGELTARVEGNRLQVFGGAEENGKNKFYFFREIDPAGYVIHNSFEVKPPWQGQGIGKDILAGQIALYQKMGLSEVQLTANIDVGGYAWAKYGFVPVGGLHEVLPLLLIRQARETIKTLEDTDQIDSSTAKHINMLLDSGDRKSIWSISDLTQPVGKSTLGKALLLDRSWRGKLDLNDPDSMKRFHDYVGK